jgi:Domain of unknown function (DUF4440)
MTRGISLLSFGPHILEVNMKRSKFITLAIAASALLALTPARAQQGRWADANDETAQWMIAKERLWAEQACTHNGIVKTLLADDFQGTSPAGARYSKSDSVKRAENSKSDSRDCRLNETKVHFFGGNVALVYGSESAVSKTSEGKDEKECLVWTDTWLKRDGTWQIVSAQDTKVDCK